jgi:type VI secretion system protein ImpG
MEELLPFYERELSLLRQYARAFAERNPKIAARLAMASDNSEDPHVERMIESSALLGARLGARIEDEYPEFTEALLDMLYPHYLRAIPSCSIAQFATDSRTGQLTEVVTVKRGAALEARVGECRFRTVYDVTVLPLRLTEARYSATATAPMSTQLPAHTTGLVSISFEPATEAEAFAATQGGSPVRIHLTGQQSFVSALTDTLLMRPTAAFAEADGSGRWKALSHLPFSAVGFEDQDALIGGEPDAPAAFRRLMEFFAFPEKFYFIDLDFARLLRATGSCKKLTLHIAVANVLKDSSAAHVLGTLRADNLRLFCTPVINLFKREALPLRGARDALSYPVIPEAPRVPNTEIYSIDSVYTIEQTAAGKVVREIPPYRSMRHDESAQSSRTYWLARRDRWVAQQRPGYETEISFVSIGATPAELDPGPLGIELTCTNRDLPPAMPFGMPGGDLLNEDASFACTISMLRAPTRSATLAHGNRSLWRIVAQLTPNALSLDLAGLKALLYQHAHSASTSMSTLIDGIAGLDHRPCMRWMPAKPLANFVRGIEVLLTIDEPAFNGVSLGIFIGVMERFFEPYAHSNSFTQLVVLSKNTGNEIRRCAPRQGTSPLL